MKRRRFGTCFVVVLCLFIGSTRQSQTAAAAPAVDNGDPALIVYGHCLVSEPSGRLNGICAGVIPVGTRCRLGSDALQCPAGAKPRHKTTFFCLLGAEWTVDSGRGCAFPFKSAPESRP